MFKKEIFDIKKHRKDLFIPDPTGKASYVTDNNYYPWFYSVAKFIKDKIKDKINYLEIGVLYGGSVVAILKGLDGSIGKCILIDDASYDRKSNNIAKDNIKKNFPNLNFDFMEKSYKEAFLEIGNNYNESFDLIVIDHDHSYESTLVSLTWAIRQISDNGIIMLDDTAFTLPEGSVREALFKFLKDYENEIEYYLVDKPVSLTGMCFIAKKVKEEKNNNGGIFGLKRKYTKRNRQEEIENNQQIAGQIDYDEIEQ